MTPTMYLKMLSNIKMQITDAIILEMNVPIKESNIWKKLSSTLGYELQFIKNMVFKLLMSHKVGNKYRFIVTYSIFWTCQ